jgi:hypothetical protein
MVRNRRVSPIAVRPGEGPLTKPTADARACRWEPVKIAPIRHCRSSLHDRCLHRDRGCDRSKPPTNRGTERPAQRRPRAEPKQESGRLAGRPSSSSDYPIECARRCSAPGVTSLRRRDLARGGAAIAQQIQVPAREIDTHPSRVAVTLSAGLSGASIGAGPGVLLGPVHR